MKKKILMYCAGLGLFILLLAPCTEAARPLATEDAGVAGDKNVQAEISLDYASTDTYRNYTFLFVPVYGIGEKFEISAEFPYLIVKPGGEESLEGLSDINIVLKTLLVPETAKKPALLLKTVVKLNNGGEEEGFGSGDIDAVFTGVFSKDLKPFVVHANLGYTFTGKKRDGSLKNYMLYSIAMEYSLNKVIKFMSEIYGESNSHFDIGAFRHHVINPLIGLTYQFNEKTVLDISFKSGLAGWKNEEFGFSMGLSLTY
ncbi:MAG: transporter [bacterium]